MGMEKATKAQLAQVEWMLDAAVAASAQGLHSVAADLAQRYADAIQARA